MHLKEMIEKEVYPRMCSEYKVPKLGLPYLKKATINVGIGKIADRKDLISNIEKDLAAISGQKPKTTSAKKSISGFKIRAGQTVGFMVTLRGKRMWDFTERLTKIAYPRIRDFDGISRKSFDKNFNFTIGLTEQIMFPEVKITDVRESWGMSVTFSLKNTKNKKAVEEYLKACGFIFK